MADQKVTLNVDNMSCGHCSGMVQKTLEGIPGLSDISVDLEGKKAAFATSDQDLVRTAVDAVTKAGYPASKA
ncbi:MAG: heavy-metal-associated domain-containing protein [Desulfobacterales bacterium]|nr:heavy-metal-associated domain-containing protein [Desulfobacterales bacterium]